MHNRTRNRRLNDAIKLVKVQKSVLFRVDDEDVWVCTINPDEQFKVLIVGGIHGDEPAGIYAAMQLLEDRMKLPKTMAISIIPCFNPTGFNANTRENSDGQDINRIYKTGVVADEKNIFDDLFDGLDLFITLHEDDVHDGAYVYASTSQEEVGPIIINALKKKCRLTTEKTIFGEPCENGLITNLNFNKPKHKYSVEGHASILKIDNFCVETSMQDNFENRINGHVEAVKTILDYFSS